MNLIILEETDFTGGSRTQALITGRSYDHVVSVIGIHKGDALKVGLLNGKMGSGTVVDIGKGKLLIDVALDTDPPPPAPVTLIMALPRPKSLKKALETAASMGVKKICIIESRRVEKSYWTSPVLEPDSLREHLILGLEQARDTVLPDVQVRRRFKPFVEDEVPLLIQGSRPFVAHPYESAECPYCIGRPLTLAIGPEGGFIPYEIGKFRECGFEPVTVGPRILRVETAIPAFLGRLL